MVKRLTAMHEMTTVRQMHVSFNVTWTLKPLACSALARKSWSPIASWSTAARSTASTTSLKRNTQSMQHHACAYLKLLSGAVPCGLRVCRPEHMCSALHKHMQVEGATRNFGRDLNCSSADTCWQLVSWSSANLYNFTQLAGERLHSRSTVKWDQIQRPLHVVMVCRACHITFRSKSNV